MRLLRRNSGLGQDVRSGVDAALQIPLISKTIDMVRRNPRKAVAASLVAAAGAMIAGRGRFAGKVPQSIFKSGGNI